MAVSLPAWVVLDLREPLEPAELVDRARQLGLRIEPTQEGFSLPGGFLAWLAPPPRALDHSVAEGEPEIGPVALHISGGTNETERQSHQRPLAERVLTEQRMAELGFRADPDARVESGASRKMTALTHRVHALAPLCSTVILPMANHLVMPAEQWVAHAAEYLGGGAYTFPLWAFLKVRDDEGEAHVASSGMGPFALPEVAMPLPQGADLQDTVRALGALQREMVAEGWWPEHGAELSTEGGTLQLSRLLDAIWVGRADAPGAERARLRFARLRCMQVILGSCTHHRRPAERGHPANEHFLLGPGSVAITNGLSDQLRPGGSHDDDGLIELTLHSPELGPWADFWLDWASSSIRLASPDHPVQPYDRLVLEAPHHGIAGAILWPAGSLRPFGEAGHTIHLWDLLPILPGELAGFRAEPGSQGRWLDEREARNDFVTLRDRWTAQR